LRRALGTATALALALGVHDADGVCIDPPGDITLDGATNVVDVNCMVTTAMWEHLGQVGGPPTCLGVTHIQADLTGDWSTDATDVQVAIVLSFDKPLPVWMDADNDGCADVLPNTCEDILLGDAEAPSGTYTLDLDGPGPEAGWSVQCEMVLFGGGWTRITPVVAYYPLNAELLAFVDWEVAGIDAWSRPFTQDGAGDHAAGYEFDYLPGYTQFLLYNYQARANSKLNNSSEIKPNSFKQTVWTKSYQQGGVGDISFGSPYDPGPVTSFATEATANLECTTCTVAFPGGAKIFTVGTPLSDAFRLDWGESGPQGEGWYPWWAGEIWLR
jgi:hypothetical protein